MFDCINAEMESLKYKNEATITSRVIVPLFLYKMGYSSLEYNYQTNVEKDRLDIILDDIFVIEVKSHITVNISKNKLTDVAQLIKYLAQKNIEWGILTDGYRYMLINNKIDGDLQYKIVFDISTQKTAVQKFIKYFSYENIFVNKKTQYFADIAQFKAYSINEGISKKSWIVYQNLLFNFFDFYCQTHDYTTLSSDKHEPLSQIKVTDFFNYIDYRRDSKIKGRRISSKETIQNKYSYLFSFLSTLEKHNYIRSHQFQGRNISLKDYKKTPKIKNHNYLSSEKFDQILTYLYNSKNNYRNIAIFLLCAYYGFERSEVNDLRWEDINFKTNTITIGNRKRKMTDMLCMCIQELQKTQKSLRRKQEYVFAIYRNGKYSKITPSIINDVFNNLVRIDQDDTTWEVFSPQYVKSCLIKTMFDNGYSIEQIVAEMDMELLQILNYVSIDTIKAVGKVRMNQKSKLPVNPFKENVDRFYTQITA